jgi:ADP-dependent NAD(P)H-hydrate dehydratase / NAD(P)H-hydrate epimerase
MAKIFEIKSGVKKMLKDRETDSHKGDNGRLLIVGGSEFIHGAPLLAVKGAYRAGVDLVYLFVPEALVDVARTAMPDVIVQGFSGEHFSREAAKEVIEFGPRADALLIGPGFMDEEEAVNGVLDVLNGLHLPTVLDTSAIFALKKISKFPLEQEIIITPHRNEFRNLVDRDMDIQETDTQSMILLRSIAMDLHINIILKGASDLVASEEGEIVRNVTGNSGMTVGGTGDVLAGVAGAFLAQGNSAFVSSQAAVYVTGLAGDVAKKRYGDGFMASDVAEEVRV